MKVRRGFTLTELMVVVAIIGILSFLAMAGMRSMKSSETLSGTVLGLQTMLQGLRSKALTEQRDHVFVIVNGDGTDCRFVNASGCARWWILAAPDPAAWSFATFDPATPGANVGEVVDSDSLGPVLLNPSVAGRAGPPPFEKVLVLDAPTTRVCGAGTCTAVRFRANGNVEGELVAGGNARRGGIAIPFVTDVETRGGVGARSILLVGFPNGIIKTYPY